MALPSLCHGFETNLMSNRKVIELVLQLKSTKAHGKNYMKVKPHLVRHLLRNSLFHQNATFFLGMEDSKQVLVILLVSLVGIEMREGETIIRNTEIPDMVLLHCFPDHGLRRRLSMKLTIACIRFMLIQKEFMQSMLPSNIMS